MPGLSTYAGASVVVTGATGFVGARVCRELGAHGARITAFHHEDGTGTWRLAEAAEAIRFVEVDLTDPVATRAALAEAAPVTVFHLATYYAADNDVDLPSMIDVNVKAGAVLVAACRGIESLRMLVNVGTCAEYGDFRDPADESTPLAPNNVYASTKAAQTIVMGQLGRDLGVQLVTLRLYNMYGECEKPSRIVPHVILSLLRGQPVAMTGGEQAKDYTYVGDVAEALLAAGASSDAAGRVVNIGSGTTITMRRLVEEIARHFPGSEELLEFGAKPYREDEMWFQGTDTSTAEDLLGWRAATSLEDGIARVVGWYRGNAERFYADE